MASIEASLKVRHCEALNPNHKSKAGLAPHKPMITQDFLEVELTHSQCHSRLALGVIIVIIMSLSNSKPSDMEELVNCFHQSISVSRGHCETLNPNPTIKAGLAPHKSKNKSGAQKRLIAALQDTIGIPEMAYKLLCARLS